MVSKNVWVLLIKSRDLARTIGLYEDSIRDLCRGSLRRLAARS